MLGIQYKSQFDVFLTRKVAESLSTIDNVTAPDVVDYSYLASAADIGSGEITDQMIADLSITTSKLANLAVDTSKLANLAVEAAKLANSSVESTKIANAAVGSAAIAALAVGTAHIANLAVDSAKVANTITGKNIVSSANNNRVSLLNGDYFQIVVSGVETGKIYGTSGSDIVIQGADDIAFVAGGEGRCGVHSGAFKPIGTSTYYNLGENTTGGRWQTLFCNDAHVYNGATLDCYVATSNGGSTTKKLDIEDGIVYDR